MIWLSVDPGEDTGWALWNDNQLIEAGTSKLWEFLDEVWDSIGPVTVEDGNLRFANVARIVCEDWALYPWKLKEMGWNKCRTARGIGAIELICRMTNTELVLQPAKIKESAEQGGAKNLFYRPLHENRHLNDAIRHGVYYINRNRHAKMLSDQRMRASSQQ